MGTGSFVHQRIVTAIKRAELVSDRMSYVVLRARWCNVIILIAHAPTVKKSVYAKDSCYKELEQMVDHFAKYHMKILLGDFKANWGDRIFSNRLLRTRVYI